MSDTTKLREIFADFARLGERPDLGLSVPLGREDRKTVLALLEDSEHVLLTDWSNLFAEGTVRSVVSDGFRMWYGILGSLADLRDIDPESLVAKAPGEQVTSTSP